MTKQQVEEKRASKRQRKGMPRTPRRVKAVKKPSSAKPSTNAKPKPANSEKLSPSEEPSTVERSRDEKQGAAVLDADKHLNPTQTLNGLPKTPETEVVTLVLEGEPSVSGSSSAEKASVGGLSDEVELGSAEKRTSHQASAKKRSDREPVDAEVMRAPGEPNADGSVRDEASGAVEPGGVEVVAEERGGAAEPSAPSEPNVDEPDREETSNAVELSVIKAKAGQGADAAEELSANERARADDEGMRAPDSHDPSAHEFERVEPRVNPRLNDDINLRDVDQVFSANFSSMQAQFDALTHYLATAMGEFADQNPPLNEAASPGKTEP